VILPACLALLGDRAWYLPSWLSWLPGHRMADEQPQPQLPEPVRPEPQPDPVPA
jgi:RND superfamily putative drug exporter